MELKDIASLINKVTNGENLTSKEACDALLSIVQKDESGLFQLSFLTALSAKGETLDVVNMKDKALANLDVWMSEFYTIAKIAMEENVQLLQTVGVLR